MNEDGRRLAGEERILHKAEKIGREDGLREHSKCCVRDYDAH